MIADGTTIHLSKGSECISVGNIRSGQMVQSDFGDREFKILSVFKRKFSASDLAKRNRLPVQVSAEHPNSSNLEGRALLSPTQEVIFIRSSKKTSARRLELAQAQDIGRSFPHQEYIGDMPITYHLIVTELPYFIRSSNIGIRTYGVEELKKLGNKY